MTVVSLHRRTLHLVLASLLTASAGALAASPVIDLSPTGVLQQLPRPQADPASVSIYEFRSGVSEINARAATDMFKTALVQSGQFRVVERSRLNEGVLREKQLNAQGQTSGQLAQKQLREARYLFEGTISEAAISTRQDQGVISIGGMQLGGGNNEDMLSIDVRVVHVESGDILDVVQVRQALAGSTVSVGGIGTLINTVLAERGRSPSALMPDVSYQTQRKDSVDQALRACIETAVAELAKRFTAKTGR